MIPILTLPPSGSLPNRSRGPAVWHANPGGMAILQGTCERLATQLDVLSTFLEGPSAEYAEIVPEDSGWSAKENVAHLAGPGFSK